MRHRLLMLMTGSAIALGAMFLPVVITASGDDAVPVSTSQATHTTQQPSTTTTTIPVTITTVPPVVTTTIPRVSQERIAPASGSCADADIALRAAGANDQEVAFALPIANRESGCTLTVVADRPSTGDYSWGPWQINYYGSLYDGRVTLLGEPSTNIESWDRAARNFLTLLRTSGACHWQPPNYCS